GGPWAGGWSTALVLTPPHGAYRNPREGGGGPPGTPAGKDRQTDGADIQAGGGGGSSQTQNGAQYLPAEAAADGARQAIAHGPEIDVLRHAAGGVAAKCAGDQLDDQCSEVHGVPPLAENRWSRLATGAQRARPNRPRGNNFGWRCWVCGWRCASFLTYHGATRRVVRC